MSEARSGVGLIAMKGLRYGTRRMVADTAFTASKRDARLLVAIGKARYATENATASDGPPVDIAALRSAYTAKFGKKPFAGWDAETLQAKIAESDKA